MMRLLASDRKLTEITVNDSRVIKRGKDATFHVPDDVGRSIARSSEFCVVGANLRGATGYRCRDCEHLGVFKDRCRCGSDALDRED